MMSNNGSTSEQHADVAIVGGGIVGLATARELLRRYPALRLTFLVADAPAHLDYAQDYDYVQEARVAVAKGIKVYTIAASNSSEAAEYQLRQIAQMTLGHFIFLTYQSGMNAGTPGDTTTHHVDPAAFTVERLDDLVVQAIEHELARAQGKG